MSKKIKKIVCLGGGNAMPRAVLQGLKKYPIKLTAICAMLDSGGSAGRLRKDYKIISPGDIRRAFITLANTSPLIEDLFNYRFEAGQLKGHNFANLLIAALELTTNNYEKTLATLRDLLKVEHEVLPVTLDRAQLCAILENRKIIYGENNIDRPKHNGNLKIKKVFLQPKAKAYPKTIVALRKADLIVIGPGDLYSTLAQILLTEGIAKTIRESKGRTVYICNLMTKYGETNNFKILDFTNQIENWIGKALNFVIYNSQKPSKKLLLKWKKLHPELLEMVKINENLDKNNKDKFLGFPLLAKNAINHDPTKLAKILIKLL